MKKGTRDRHSRAARKEGFAARSAYKLRELDEKFGLVRAGDRVLDLGAAPGSWMQYLSGRVGPTGKVVGVDRHPIRIELAANEVFFRKDILTCDLSAFAEHARLYDAVLSDLAPQTTGTPEVDHLRSLELCRAALGVARRYLKKGGAFVCKMYQGEESKAFLDELGRHFAAVKIRKPEASRPESREIFYVALEFLGGSGARREEPGSR